MRQVGGCLAVAIGLFFGVGMLLNLGGQHPVSALIVGFLQFGVAPVALGVWLLKPRARLARLPAADQAWESELLRLAARRDGSLSVAEVVAHTDLGAGEAEQRLDAMWRRGLCELRVSEHGVLLYRFNELPTAEHKRLAQGVLDE